MRKALLVALIVGMSACGDSGGSGDSDTSGGSGDAGQNGNGNGNGDGDGGGGEDPNAPDTTITSSPEATLPGNGTAAFEFECDKDACVFECAWDDGKFESCKSPASKTGFTDGAHSFAVRAASAGIADETPAKASFAVDAVAPTPMFVTEAADGLNSRPSEFSLGCSEGGCSYECSVDDAAFAQCDENVSLDGLAPGPHKLEVRATDAVGNVGTATVSHTWNLTFGWRALAVADSTACAINGERELYCWGSDNSGMLGDGGATNESTTAAAPIRIGTGTNWVSILGSEYTMCATTVEGDRYCWGANYDGQFGDEMVPANTAYTEPTKVNLPYAQHSIGDAHACAIDGTGTLLCWGDGYGGRVGDGVEDGHSVFAPTAVGTAKWKSVAAGTSHTCAIKQDGTLHCFGENSSGECGQPSETEYVLTPTQVGSDTDWATVRAGASITCGLKTDGKIYCFGASVAGPLAKGNPPEVPTQVGTESDWTSLSVLNTNPCGLKADGSLYCWGTNDDGQLATLPALSSSTPVQIDLDEGVSAVFGTQNLRCTLSESDRISCWGSNNAGGLGRGVKGSEPDLLAIDSGFTAISVSTSAYGNGTTGGGCGIKTDGKLYCWGLGHFVGQADTLLALVPTKVSDDTGWTAIDVLASTSPVFNNGGESYSHACGIRNGDLYCWGLNDYGQLGLGDTSSRSVPTKVTAIADTWTQIAVGTFTTCGITSGKRMYCWGRNQSGMLGQGDNVQRNTPTQVGSNTDWDRISIANNVLGHRENGTLWTWGPNAANVPIQADGGAGAATDWVDGKAGSNFWCAYKATGALYCRTLNQSVQQVSGVNDVASLFSFEGSYCGKRVTGDLFCIVNPGDGWTLSTPPYQVPPTGTDWLSWEFAGQLSCGVKTTGERLCKGLRRAGSFGDGFDERVPTSITMPE